MSNGIALGPTANKFEMFSLPTNKRNYQGKLIDSRTIFEANPSLKNYSELEPYVRQMSQSSKMGMLTQGGTLLKMFEKNARVIYKDDGADGYTHKLYIQGGELRGVENFDIASLDVLKGGNDNLLQFFKIHRCFCRGCEGEYSR